MKRDFIALTDHNKETLERLVKRGVELKSGKKPESGSGKVLAMILNKPSTRTSVSFQVAMYRLGGTAIFLGSESLQMSRGETVADTAKTLSRYVDAIMIRTYNHQDAVELAAAASVPVINGLTDLLHPCQALGDVMSLTELKGNRYGDLHMAYIGDGNNVCNSLINAAGIFGFKFTAAVPEGYEPDPLITEQMQARNPQIKIVRDPDEAACGADAVYTDVWVSMGDEGEGNVRNEIFKKYKVDMSLLKRAKPDVMVMHCLPAHRGEEISPEVIDGPHSYVFDQAENRLHIQEAILEFLVKTV